MDFMTYIAGRSDDFSGFFVMIGVKSVLLLSATMICISLLRSLSAATRHQILFMALSGLLLLPVLSFILPTWHTYIVDRQHTQPISRQIALQTDPQASTQPMAAQPQTATKRGSTFQLPAGAPIWSPHAWLLPSLWFLGFLMVLGHLMVGLLRIRRIGARSSMIEERDCHEAVRNVCHQLGITASIALLESSQVDVPITWGVRRPKLILPAEWRDWSSGQRRMVLLHELAHIKRLDWLTQIIARIACGVYWFNPLAWQIYKKVRLEREQASDNLVLDAGVKSSAYANVLLEIAGTLNRGGTKPASAAVAMATKSHLEGRLLAILEPGKNRLYLRGIRKYILAVTFLSATLPLAAFSPYTSPYQSGGAPVASSVLDELEDEKGPEALVVVIYGHSIGRNLPYNYEDRDEDFLRSAFEESDWQKRAAAAYALGATRRPIADLVIKALRDERWEVRHFGAWAAEKTRDKSAIGLLQAAVKDKDWRVSHLAVQALAALDRDGAIEPFMEALRHESWQTAHLAAWHLGRIGDPRAVTALISALSNSKWMARHTAAWALGEIGGSEAVPALIAALQDRKWEVRKEAAKALGRIGDPRAVSPLQKSQGDRHEKVRGAVRLALESL